MVLNGRVFWHIIGTTDIPHTVRNWCPVSTVALNSFPKTRNSETVNECSKEL